MQIPTITGEPRTVGNRHSNERLRRAGKIPGVIYGRGEPNESVAVSAHELGLALASQSHLVKLAVDGRENSYLIKDVQYDHLMRSPLHIDLMRVSLTEKVRVKVALEFKGTAKGTTAGGVLMHPMTEIEIECLPLEIPEVIRVNVEPLEVGQSLHVRELSLPPGVTALTDGNATVAAVFAKKEELPTVTAAAEGEAAAEPEVIGRQAKTEEAEAEGA